ncbi:hypothetical protein [uncultured Treponema sp.]|uniref:hypothetical protein n=1 Tax=uncultured Treponema sp. TaxID=162155 RepID=UPI0025908F34|nr:hypothetical protein [uncultured Treponema sp.]
MTNKKIQYKISSLFCFLTIFSVVVDPSNTILHIKDFCFVLFCITSFPYLNFKKALIFIYFLLIYFVSFSFQEFFFYDQIDYSYAFSTLKTFIFLWLLFLVSKNSRYLVFDYFYYSVLLLSFIISVLFLCCKYYPPFENALFLLATKGFLKSTVFMSRRIFFGIEMFQLFYKTSPLAIFTLSFSLYKYLETKRTKYFIHSIFFSLFLLASGTRANIFSLLLIFFLSILVYAFYHNKKIIFILLSTFVIIGFLFATYKLLTESGEASLTEKTLHMKSYLYLFSQNPIKYLLIGEGPGSLFYSLGNNRLQPQTELCYFDLIRNYGLILTCGIILIYLYSLFLVKTKLKGAFGATLSFGYIAFLFICGTNPFLVSSTGFIVLILMFYIADNYKIISC